MKIAGRDFVAAVSGRVSMKNTIQEHKVESGYIISDHIKPEPIEVHLDIYADRDGLAFLRQLKEEREVFSIDFEDERGVYENMVVESMDVEREFENSYTVSLILKQIQTAELTTEIIILEDVQLTEDKNKIRGGSVSGEQSNAVPDAPEKQENKSWLDSILDWFGGLWGG